MANTQRNGNGNVLTPDQEAWNNAARARKYAVYDNQVWAALAPVDELPTMFPIPPIVGFATLTPAVQALVFHAVSQFVTYRVAQNVDGESVTKAVANAIAGELPGVRETDARAVSYLHFVRNRVNDAIGPLPEKATEEQIAERNAIVLETASEHRGAMFDAAVNRAIERGNAVIPAKERKRRKAKPSGVAALDLSVLQLS